VRATKHLIAAEHPMAAEHVRAAGYAMTQYGGRRPLAVVLKAPEISGALR
jgi:hypothetical protein